MESCWRFRERPSQVNVRKDSTVHFDREIIYTSHAVWKLWLRK
jgi:hypothetical protein